MSDEVYLSHLAHGGELLRAGKLDEACVELEQARAAHPEDTRAHSLLGVAYFRGGRLAEARDAFRAAQQEDLALEVEAQISRPVVRAPEPGDTFARERGVVTVGAFATEELIRPDEGELPFEIVAKGALVVRVRGRVLSRTEGVLVSGGNLAYEAATRRTAEGPTDVPFGSASRPVCYVSGEGHLIASPRGGVFSALRLREDVVYIREDLVYAFEESLAWHNVQIEGDLPMVAFRGHGTIAVRTRTTPLTVKLAAGKILYVDVAALAGWIGEISPRVVAPTAGGAASAPFVECSGEGVVLVEEPTEVALGAPA